MTTGEKGELLHDRHTVHRSLALAVGVCAAGRTRLDIWIIKLTEQFKLFSHTLLKESM